MRPGTVAAAAVTGLATGPRSFTGLAAVTFVAPRESRAQPDRFLGHPATKTAIGLIAVQEWVLDKLPKTPSRIEWLGLVTRATGAGASGAILARRAQVGEHAAVQAVSTTGDAGDGDPPPPDWQAIATCASTSAGVALGVALIGVHLRAWFDRHLGHDWPGAALEDASSAGLASAAVYLSSIV